MIKAKTTKSSSYSLFFESVCVWCSQSIPETDFDPKSCYIQSLCADADNSNTNCRVPGYLSVFFLVNFSFNLSLSLSFSASSFFFDDDVGDFIVMYTDEFKMTEYHDHVYSEQNKQIIKCQDWSSRQKRLKQTLLIEHWSWLMSEEEEEEEALTRNR